MIFILEETYFPQFEDGHNAFQMCRMWPLERSRVVLGKGMSKSEIAEIQGISLEESDKILDSE